jgi:hypothetical protein
MSYPCTDDEIDIQQIYDQVHELFDKNEFKELIAYEQGDLVVAMGLMNNVWSLCVRDVLMIDFDFKDSITREQAIKIITKYTKTKHQEGTDLLFEMFDTDRGVHAFLVNQPMSHTDPEAIQMMIDLDNDPYYIGFSKIRGFCMRLSPKIDHQLTLEELYDHLDKEFISKPFVQSRYIGYGTVDPYIEKIIALHTSLINWFKYQYKSRLPELTQFRYVYETDRYQMAPPESFLDEVYGAVVERLEELGLKKPAKKYQLRYDVRTRPYEETYIKIYEQKGMRLIYDLYYAIWAICTPYFLMVDFDENDDFSKLDAIESLETFVQKEHQAGHDYLFWIYDTDRGIHAFLMNHPALYTSELTEYVLNALDNDPKHIDFVIHTGHCTRIANKIFRMDDKPNYLEEFVARKCFGDFCEIGYGTPLPYFIKILDLHQEMIDYLKLMYKSVFPEMTIPTHLIATNSREYVPKPYLLDQIRSHFISTLVNLNLDTEDLTFKGLFNPNSAERYTDLISEKALLNCKETNMEQFMEFVEEVLRPSLLQNNFRSATILIKAPAWPFMMFQDHLTHMIFLTFYDLLILDWDLKDGIEKEAVVPMLERFINSQALLPENKRLFLSTPCFKLYETDNGVHAYLISHRVPYDTYQSSTIMLSLCSDFFYASFSRITGYSSRISPKVYDKSTDSLYEEADIKKQFVQKPGVNGILYVGDGIIDAELEAMVEIIHKLQQYVLRQPVERIINHEIQDDVVEVAKFLYRTMKPKYQINDPNWIYEVDT